MKLFINAIPIRPGGGLTVLLGLLDGLRRAGCSLHTTVCCSAQETREALEAAGTADRVASVVPRGGAAKAFLWQNTALGNLLETQQADILLGFNHYLRNIPCPQVVYHLNLRRFSREHRSANWNERLQERVRDWSARLALQHAAVNIFESEFLREAARRTARRLTAQQRVIYIGLPDAVVDRALLLPDRYDGAPRLLSVTSPLDHKDNPTLLRTLAELVRRRPEVPWYLDIAGGTDPAGWSEFRKLAAELGIADRVTWHGYCDHERLDTLMRRSLCMVATSRMESFAMVALESMARRCPAIVARTAAMPESVGDAGLLVRPGCAGEFADAVMNLYQNSALRDDLVERGVRWIQDFRWSSCGSGFCRLFKTIGTLRCAA